MLKPLLYLLKPVLRAATELLFYAPIWLTLLIYTLESSSISMFALLLVVIYLVPQYMFQSGKSIKNGLRLLLIVLLGAIPAAFFVGLYPDQLKGHLLFILAGGFIGTAFAASSFASLKNGWEFSFSNLAMLVMLLASLILQLLKVLVLSQLASFNTVYYTMAIAACIIFLYLNNERSIRSQQMIDETSATIRRSIAMNRIYITLLALVVAAIAWFRGIQEQLEAWVKALFQSIIAWLFREREPQEPITEEQPQAAINPMEGLAEEKEPSAFWLLLEQIMKWIVIAFFAVAVIVLIYYIITRLIPMLLKYIHRILNHRALLKMSEEGYQDEIEGITPEKTEAKRERRKMMRAVGLRKWNKLDNVQKLKLLYVHALQIGLKAGKPITESNTAQENLQLLMDDKAAVKLYGKLSSAYNRMRYGNDAADSEQLEQLREQLEQQKQGNKAKQ